MNWNTLVDPAVSGRLCLTLLHSVWQVALLAVVAWGVGRFWKRRSVESRYVANVTALLAAFVAMPITFVLLDDNKQTGTPVIDNPVAVDVAESEPITVVATPPFAEMITPEPMTKIELRPNSSEPAEFIATGPPPVVQVAEEPSPGWLQLAPWIVAFYTTGVVLMLVRLMVAVLKQNRLGTRAQPITNGPLLETLQRLAHTWSMRVVPTLARAEQIAVPIVIGIVRPTILLPTSAISGLTTDELEMILTHELAHVRRHDMWVNLLQRAAEAVLFFNPALWYLSRRISTLREYCCDEMTCHAQSSSDLEPRIRYATALLRVVELARPNAIPTNDLAALAASGQSISQLRRRVSRLLGEPLREPLRISRGGVVAVLVLAIGLAIAPSISISGTQSDTKQQGLEDTDGSKEDQNLNDVLAQAGEAILKSTNHKQAAFNVVPSMLSELSADDAWTVVKNVWPKISSDEVKTGVLKAFAFARHPRVLDVLDLGATDDSGKVKEYAYSYLTNYALRDFKDPKHDYASWRRQYQRQDIDTLLEANCRWFVEDLRNRQPVDDRIWLIRFEKMLNLSGGKSTYPSKAKYLREAGLSKILKSWQDDPGAGKYVKRTAKNVLVKLDKRRLNKSESHRGADLRGQSFVGMILDKGVDRLLENADLRECDLSGVTFVGGFKSFYKSNFSGANLTDSILTGQAAFQAADFDQATLTDAVLRGGDAGFQMASFDEANLKNIRMSGGGSSFQLASFRGSDLTAARLQGTGPAFQKATFDDANLFQATIQCNGGSAFQNVSLNNTNFSDAVLESIDRRSLDSCMFDSKTPPKYSSKTRFPRGFDPVSEGWKRVADKDASQAGNAKNERTSRSKTVNNGEATTGIVRNADGSPAVEAKLRATAQFEMTSPGHVRKVRFANDGKGFWGKVFATTDAQGRFKMDQLTSGVRYSFNVKTRNGAHAIVKDLQAGQQDVQIVVPKRRDLVVKINGDMNQLYLRGGRPFIRVRLPVYYEMPDDSTYRDLIGADVQFNRFGDNRVQVIFPGLPIDLNLGVKKQQVEVTLGNDRKTTKTIDVNLTGNTVVEFDLPDAKKGPILRGRLTDDSGSGLPGVVVTLFNGRRGLAQGQETTTNANGEYVFDPLSTGNSYYFNHSDDMYFSTGVVFEHADFVSADGKSWREVTVPIVDRHEELLDLKMSRGGKISGVVVEKTSRKPLAKLDLRIDADDDNHAFTVGATTDDKGHFTSAALLPGKYAIVINDNDFQGQEYPVVGHATVRAGETSEVRLSVKTSSNTNARDPKQSLLDRQLGIAKVERSNKGVEPDESDIISIHIRGENMTDELLKRISTLPKLRELYFTNAPKVTPRGWAHLSKSKKLKKITLSEVTPTDAVVESISQIKSLRELNLYACGITDAGVKYIEDMPQLTHLQLNNEGRLTDAALTSIAKLKRLKHLELPISAGTPLGRMQVSETGMKQLAVLQELEVLRVNGQPVTAEVLVFPRLTTLTLGGLAVDDATAAQIAKCRNLKSLVFHHTRITDAGLKQIATISTLRRLEIGGEFITEAGIKHLTRLPDLDHISLQDPQVNDKILGRLSEIKSLTRIDLSGRGFAYVRYNLFTNEGLRQLKELPKLHTMWLHNSTSSGYLGLKELKQLRMLVMARIDISNEELDELGAALPKTRISADDGGRLQNRHRGIHGFGGIDFGGTRWQSGLKD